MTARTILYIVISYLSGSVLFAVLAGDLLGKRELLQSSEDKNPGTANAFKYGGFWCGMLTLAGDLAKGWLPVHLYLRAAGAQDQWALALIVAAPVIGHIFPVFRRFRGGKGIAVTFGVLLGLCPYETPVAVFAAVFLLLSAGLRIDPTFYRTFVAYPLTLAVMAAVGVARPVCVGFGIITAAVCLRLHMSKEVREKMEVSLLWTH